MQKQIDKDKFERDKDIELLKKENEELFNAIKEKNKFDQELNPKIAKEMGKLQEQIKKLQKNLSNK